MTRIESSVRPTIAGSRAIAVVRIALVCLAAGAVLAALLLTGIGGGGAPSSSHRYACPMHSEVTASSPGDCPICGMALEEVDAASRAAMLHEPSSDTGDQVGFAQLRVSYEATMLMRFAVAAVRRNAVPGEVFAPAIVAPGGEIVAELYRDELASLDPDERAVFQPAARPEAAVAIQRAHTPPVVDSASEATARVEFRAEPGGAAPPPGQVGWVKLGYKLRAMLIVRSAAVLRSPDGPYVLVFSNQRGGVTRRRIEIGKDYSGMTAVVSGLHDKEFVVMANAFSVDAERRLQAAP
jgi:hypothetical protein